MEDYKRIEEKLDLALIAIKSLGGTKVCILTSQDIQVRLKISYRTFQNRKPILIKFGLVKVGNEWRIKETDFQNYLEFIIA